MNKLLKYALSSTLLMGVAFAEDAPKENNKDSLILINQWSKPYYYTHDGKKMVCVDETCGPDINLTNK